MSGLFSSPSMPAPPPPAPPPVVDNSALQNAAKLEAENLRKRKGFKSTWLTSGLGDINEQTQKATLLGGGS